VAEFNKTGAAVAGTSVSGPAQVERGVNEARMGAFALIFAVAVTAGLTVGYGEASLVLGVIAFLLFMILVAAVVALIYRVRPVRHAVMGLMHWLTGE
jgi:cellobiose-specific phosphotransferase system component IIC